MSLRVLVVEDNALNAALARIVLESDGHQVDEASGSAALRQRLSGPPVAVVLMDIQLADGDVDGIALLPEVRAVWPAVPVVALTAHALAGDEERLLAAGFDGVMTKPIDTRQFSSDVARFAAGGRRSAG